MKLNRVLSTFVLTGLFTIAAMAAQAQTRVMVRFGSPAAGIAVNYAQQVPGAGYTWVSGYYSGMQWIPGQWVYRVDSHYQRNNYYGNRNGYYNNDRRDNGNAYYGNNNGRFQNDQRYGNNNRYGQNGNNNRNDRNNNGWNGRNNQNYNRGGRH